MAVNATKGTRLTVDSAASKVDVAEWIRECDRLHDMRMLVATRWQPQTYYVLIQGMLQVLHGGTPFSRKLVRLWRL